VTCEEIPLKHLAYKAKMLPEAKWVYVYALDEYSTIIPLEDFY